MLTIFATLIVEMVLKIVTKRVKWAALIHGQNRLKSSRGNLLLRDLQY